MADLVELDAAIEGDAIAGSSRHPLRALGMQPDGRGGRCYRFVGEHNTRAKATTVGLPPPRFFPEASLDPNDALVCEKVLIHSEDRKPAQSVAAGSARHKTNAWSFNRRTGARVSQVHTAIKHAIEARLRAGLP